MAATPRLPGTRGVRSIYALIRGRSGECGVLHGAWASFRSYVCSGGAPDNRSIFHGFHHEAEALAYWHAVFDEAWMELPPRT